MNTTDHLFGIKKTEGVRTFSGYKSNSVKTLGLPTATCISREIPTKPPDMQYIKSLGGRKLVCGWILHLNEDVEDPNHSRIPIGMRIRSVIFVGQQHDVCTSLRID